MKADGDLDQTLQESFFFGGSGPPHVLQDFVRIEKFPAIEQLNTVVVSGEIHVRKSALEKICRG